ncbi:LysE/ArgO family amino acid transporter [Neisseria animaloris]|uniref:LysE/ArgO family amino acid transporter n=1 Tax=Neisseria animaloris TaxID=326522 RepID=UPI000D31DAE4|nr:LysE/ArgO family amino acid transporter [Neisseria animaloris]
MMAFFNGFMISAGLIVAIGAQNAFVLRKGLLKQNVGVVVSLCWLCDLVLIGLGVFGISVLLSDNVYATAALSLAGGLFLLGYGTLSLRRAYKGGGHLSRAGEADTATPSALQAAAATLALTLLNPHVYLDTVILIGGSAAGLSAADKLKFLIGAVTASGVWFAGLGYGARLLQPLFRRERIWRILDSLIAIMMFYLAYGLLRQVFSLFSKGS